jgi:transmembrane sensor
MKDGRLFDIADFVMDEDFIRWVYDRRPEDERFWQQWLERHPDKQLVVAEARRILESLHIPETPVSEALLEQETGRLLQTIRITEQEPPAHSSRRRIPKWIYAAAAVLLPLIAFLIYSIYQPQQQAAPAFSYASVTASRQLHEQANAGAHPLTLTLPDGSSVELSPNSRIAYAGNFDTTAARDVYLSGEAFFQVAADPNRPFRVFANNIVTKVLGTSFRVRSFDSDTTIAVTVRTGKVSVYAQALSGGRETAAERPSEVILMPNQQLVYEKAAQTFQKLLLEAPQLIDPDTREEQMIYEEKPLAAVFEALSKAYDIHIVYDEELLKHCTVTADLRNEPFYHKLDLICRAVGARYEIIEGQVVIQGGVCK